MTWFKKRESSHRPAIKALPTYMAPKVTASAVRSVRKRKVLVLNGRFRPKRSGNGLYQGHTARTGAGDSTNVAPRHPGSLFSPPAHLLAKPHFSPFCLIWGLSLGVSLIVRDQGMQHCVVEARAGRRQRRLPPVRVTV